MQSIYLHYDSLQRRIKKLEDDVIQGVAYQELDSNAFKYLMRIINDSRFSFLKSYTENVQLYAGYPIDVSLLLKLQEQINFDIEAIYGILNGINQGLGLVDADTSTSYLYRGTKYLSDNFKTNYLRALFNKQMLVYDNFQSKEKSDLDGKFFVDRGLGFVAKNIESMSYYPATWSWDPSYSLNNIVLSSGYYPPSKDRLRCVRMDLDQSQLVNFLYLDCTFPEDQFLDAILSINYSVDGVNYYACGLEILNYVNASFRSIYDQNSFTGFIPITPTFMKHLKVHILLKTDSPEIVINDLKPIGAVFNQDLATISIPILSKIPFLGDNFIEATIYQPFAYNYFEGHLSYESGGEIKLNLEMSLNKKTLESFSGSGTDRSLFSKNFYMYTSPILFDYSVFVGRG